LAPHWRLDEYVTWKGVLANFGTALVTLNGQTTTCSSKEIQNFRKQKIFSQLKQKWTFSSIANLSVQGNQADSIRKVVQKFRRILILWKRHGAALTSEIDFPQFLFFFLFFFLSILF
jgi:hypothetical protein